MKPETVIIRTAERLRRRAALRMKTEKVLDSFFYGAVGAAAYTALVQFSERVDFELWVFSLPLLISPLVGVVKAARVQPDPKRLMAEADLRFALRERLSTAYELLKERCQSSLRPLQIRDAALHARRSDLMAFSPGPRLRWRLRHTLLAAAFAGITLFPSVSDWRSPWPGAPAHFRPRDVVSEMQEEQRGWSSTQGTSSPSPAAERRSERWMEILPREASSTPQAEEGAGSAAMAKVENPPFFLGGADELPNLRSLSDDEILKLVEELLGDQPGLFEPAQMRRLEEAWRSGDAAALRKFLEKLAAEGEGFSQGRSAGLRETDRTEGDSSYSMSPEERRGLSGAEGESVALKAWGYSSGIESMFEEAAEDEGGSRLTGGRQPGEERGPERGAASWLAAESAGQGSRVEGQPGKGKVLQGLVKALPVRNPSATPISEVTVQYRHRAESLMERYELPPRYREYIKRYFLAIGMNEKSEEQ